MAKRKGKECYFFALNLSKNDEERYKPITDEEAAKSLLWVAFSVPNPSDYIERKKPNEDDYKRENDSYAKIEIETRLSREHRNDPDLVAVVESLGAEANGKFASLEVVEIPDGIDWRIEEYDGSESVAEGRTW